jgi:hypothetical protein
MQTRSTAWRTKPRISLALVSLLSLVGCREKPSADQIRKAELERIMRDAWFAERSEALRGAVTKAAREYRELTADSPDGLRQVAITFNAVGDHRAALDVLQTLVKRGQASRDDRFETIDLLLMLSQKNQIVIDDATYQTNLKWLRRELEDESLSCYRNLTFVSWTEGHPEALEAIELAFGRCPVEVNRAELFRRRFELQHKPEDACDAVVHGMNSESEVARLCVEGGSPGWKVEVAKAALGQDAPARLRSAINASDVTSHVLMEFVRTSAVSQEETCAAIARAERIELRWDQPSTVGSFDELRRQRSCNKRLE